MSKKVRRAELDILQREMGQRIKWARQLVEPNRAAFARLMRVDTSTLTKIEDGDRAPSVFNLFEISHRLRVTPDYILLGSLRGIDGELAVRLVELHPELRRRSDMAISGDRY